ncbi:MAG TPA: LysR family transcriptional regulator [Burkholderiales bacterium]|nr:LysR family transcriptional regulator [Burkholderiales bacterium]
MDRLQAMEVFARVVETGNFTRAAERLRLPKATVTTLVQNLESHLGTKLLNRTTRRVNVTADGAAYYERCLRILSEVEETEQALSRTSATAKGRLRVDVPGSFGRYILMPALGEFFARYPDIRLELGCSDRPVDLLEEGVDCVVRGGDVHDTSLVARRVADCEFVTCAHIDYIERHGMPHHPSDLERHQCINYFSAKTGKIFEWNFNRGGERIVMPVQGNIAVNDGDAYLAAGLSGLGVMQAPLMQVGKKLATGQLIRLLPEWSIDPLPVWVMYPQNRHLSAKVRVFVDWVAEMFARHWHFDGAVPVQTEPKEPKRLASVS